VDLDNLSKNWDALGEEDPMWAILADPSKRGNKWGEEEFFETGREHVAEYLALLERVSPATGRGRAMDFGCGAGRLTQALADHFEAVDGIDIAPSMIRLAQDLNRHGDRVTYHLNQRDDLQLLDDNTMDLVFSLIVLQHVENRYKEKYFAEFIRVLAPKGVAMFTVPSHPRLTPEGVMYLLPNSLLNVYRKRRYGNTGVMELHPMKRDVVVEAVQHAGGAVLDVAPEPLAGDVWHSFRYIVGKPG